MKRLALAALLASLLAGCADKPTQEASIEDRAIRTQAGESQAPDTGRTPSGATAGPASGVDIDTTPIRPTVQTRGIAQPDAEVKPLGGTPSAPGGAGGAGGMLLDPRATAGPLAARRIHYDFDSAVIRDEYRALLEAHAAYLKQEPKAELIVQGHTDEHGSREYNLALGQRRAESVLRALSLLGVEENRIEAVSMGEEKPIAEGQNEAAWSQNRRAEILYVGE